MNYSNIIDVSSAFELLCSAFSELIEAVLDLLNKFVVIRSTIKPKSKESE